MTHPKDILSSEQIAELRNLSVNIEDEKQLSASILAIIYKHKWFHLLVPQAYGGKELALPETVKLFEALAYAEANIGWCVNLGTGANMFAGYLPEAFASNTFASAQTCCAGSGAISGRAQKVENGYMLTGKWKYASGANHATHFTANAYLLDENGAQIMEDDKPTFRSFIIEAQHILNHKNWNAIGLKATSSNDFEAIDVFVPEQQTFTLLRPSSFAQGTLYKFPFEQMAVVNMSCMVSGMALHFIDLYVALAATKQPLHDERLLKDNDRAIQIFEAATSTFYNARTAMYKLLQQIWDDLDANKTIAATDLKQLSDNARAMANTGSTLINQLYPLCGMSILNPQSAMNKIWRDAATASQHYLLSPLKA